MKNIFLLLIVSQLHSAESLSSGRRIVCDDGIVFINIDAHDPIREEARNTQILVRTIREKNRTSVAECLQKKMLLYLPCAVEEMHKSPIGNHGDVLANFTPVELAVNHYVSEIFTMVYQATPAEQKNYVRLACLAAYNNLPSVIDILAKDCPECIKTIENPMPFYASPLHVAFNHRKPQAAVALMAHGATDYPRPQPHASLMFICLLLRYAVEGNHINVVQLMLKNHPNLHIQSPYTIGQEEKKWQLIERAHFLKYTDIEQLLLEHVRAHCSCTLI